MIKRANSVSGNITYTPFQSTLFPASNWEYADPQYQSLAERIQRLKLQERQKSQTKQSHSKRQHVLSQQFLITQPHINESEDYLVRNPQTKYLNKQNSYRSFSKQLYENRTSIDVPFHAPLSMNRSPSMQQLSRSSSMGRLRKQSINQHISPIASSTCIQFIQKQAPVFNQRRLVAGRIYCKQQLLSKQNVNRIRRIPITKFSRK